MEEKIYFQPGNVVTLKQGLPNKPMMLVVKAEKSMIRSNDEILKSIRSSEDTLKGIRCRWFTSTGSMEEAIFNTKDLQIVEL